MNKSEVRKARKAARESGQALTGELALRGSEEFTETAAGHRARDRWAKRYDSLNGAPEGDWDR
jgi:hypothetical protein